MLKELGLAGLVMCLAAAVTPPLATADNPEHVRRLRQTRSCSGCDLSQARLAGIQAPMAELRNADLRGAILYKATLRGADLTGALLSGANFTGADLGGAHGANLSAAITDASTRCPNGTMGPC